MNSQSRLHAKEQGKNEMFLELAGFPVKKVDVNVLKDFKVIPGGQSIGVKLNTLGVLSCRSSPSIQRLKEKYLQGKLAGIQIGDIITEINGKKLKKCQMLLHLFKKQVKAINH